MPQKYFIYATFIILFAANPTKKIFGQEKGLMVDRLEALPCNPKAVADLIEFTQNENYTRVYFYVSQLWFRTHKIFNDSLIGEFKQCGLEVFAVISPGSLEPLPIKTYAEQLVDFDGIFIEYEFWNKEEPFEKFEAFCLDLRSSLPEHPFVHYIGWPGKTFWQGRKRLKFMLDIADEIAVHMYRRTVDLDYVRNRITALDVASLGNPDKAFKIKMLYSTEPTYMGSLLTALNPDEVHQESLYQFEEFIDLRDACLDGYIIFKASDLVGY